MLVAETVD
jgi:hypothetical protein